MTRSAVALFVAVSLSAASLSYEALLQQWRADQQKELVADGGWLTVAGLFWLKEGPNTIGSGHDNDIVLERGPARLGVFNRHGAQTSFQPAPGAPSTLAATSMQVDTDGKPTTLSVDDYDMYVIHRGQRYAVRLKDKHSKLRQEFTGLHWFPAKESYRVKARFVPYPTKKLISIPNVLGEVEQDATPGYAEFTLNGQALKLEPVVEEDHLFYIFRDLTAGKETYGSGRFLYSEMPKDGKVLLDFNKAVNPPCAFTPYATCPLPPPQNRLNTRIEAGELSYGHH